MSKALIILILFVIAVSGCIKNLSDIDIVDVQKNPEEFVNKDISVNGKYTLFLFSDGEYLVDEQGYKIKIDCKNSGRVFELGNEYRVSETFTYIDKCVCQRRYIMNLTEEYINSIYPQVSERNILFWNSPYLITPSNEEGWNEIPFSGKIKTSDCINTSVFIKNYTAIIPIDMYNATGIETNVIKEQRCQQNSIERDYYLKCV